MRSLIISAAVLAKLREKHDLNRREVEQAFENKCGLFLIDDREDHQTDPPTLWFIAPTNRNRLLKVIFIFIEGNVHLKSAYDAEPDAISIYEELGK
ncbi:ADP-ribosyl-(dinitrogen reductase) hydrolase [Paucibacter sp. M5-1]|uniref:ADP-ribosyl-(dinitrogen reductase) hydrolase n=1 Tax=Paucibacter sp. M5-1 TaxID=3015998 RepID=UPI0022B92481|nr:ADP-ribosyl-(dinitrogen reductase) hydrolase [Paucibacter sp. M5-1]MCZ7883775.1 ADP-ribosyl-(dinitrogen reductase) hydrolase [Paucibacter sp. M5-1]